MHGLLVRAHALIYTCVLGPNQPKMEKCVYKKKKKKEATWPKNQLYEKKHHWRASFVRDVGTGKPQGVAAL